MLVLNKGRVRPSVRMLAACCLFYLFPVILPAPPIERPKLVVGIVIDQFRYDYLLRFRSDYNAGLARMLQNGASFTDAHYLHAYTVTAVGHSTFLSGATPSVSGIIGNEWFDRPTGKTVTSVSDPATKLVGGSTERAGSSPHRLLVSTVGDELKASGSDSHVIGISIKDRAAILPAGHAADGAYWYDDKSNHWVTSTYYRKDLPAWAAEVNAQKGYERTVGSRWIPFDTKLEDKDSATPFCTMAILSIARNCGSLEATPWGNELIEEFAEAAVQGENLGHHAGTDLLTVSFSSNDYVGHAVGPDDPAVRDISIRTDRLLGKFFDYLDRRVGLANTLIVLTADHGVAPLPEVNQKRNMPGGRLPRAHIAEDVEAALTKLYGSGKWLLPSGANMPYLNLDLVHTRNLDPEAVERTAAQSIRAEPHIARVYTRHEIERGQVQKDEIGSAISRSFFGSRSGDLYVLQEPYYLFEENGTSHGTPYDYDTHVPMLFLGKGIKPGSYSRRVAVNDIAPTLATILQITPPSGSSGRVLREIMK